MPVSASYRTFVIEQLRATGLGAVTARSMFGGVGLYCSGLFIALIDDDTLYLKADDVTRAEFERVGSRPFRPYGENAYSMQYYELPAGLLEDASALRPWVERASAAARRRAAGKRTRRSR